MANVCHTELPTHCLLSVFALVMGSVVEFFGRLHSFVTNNGILLLVYHHVGEFLSFP